LGLLPLLALAVGDDDDFLSLFFFGPILCVFGVSLRERRQSGKAQTTVKTSVITTLSTGLEQGQQAKQEINNF
jgi:hypothetical protein